MVAIKDKPIKTIIIERYFVNFREGLFDCLQNMGLNFKLINSIESRGRVTVHADKAASVNYILKSPHFNIGDAIVVFPFLFWTLVKQKPQVIVTAGGQNTINNFQVLLYSKLFHVPYIQWDLGKGYQDFGHSACFSDNLEPATRLGERTKFLEEFVKTHSKQAEKQLRYKNPSPTSKMMLNSFIKGKGLKYEEIRVSNDSMFSLLSGYYATTIAGDTRVVYCSTIRRGSLTQTKNKENAYCRYAEMVREYVFFREHQLEDMYPWVTSYVLHSLTDFGLKEFGRYLKLARENRVNIWLGITKRFRK